MGSQGQIPFETTLMSHHWDPRNQSFQGQHTCQLRKQKGELGLQCRANIHPKDLTSAQSEMQLRKKSQETS